jgi:hypothetical protein
MDVKLDLLHYLHEAVSFLRIHEILPPFMEPESSLGPPCSQESATDPCSESDESSSHFHILFPLAQSPAVQEERDWGFEQAYKLLKTHSFVVRYAII